MKIKYAFIGGTTGMPVALACDWPDAGSDRKAFSFKVGGYLNTWREHALANRVLKPGRSWMTNEYIFWVEE